ncbi:MAG: aminotransferase class V-fold PLP-dependent enzyme [Nitrospina sp.]|nr:aminotransferase class V-fold PLP-dependent enzyme [Nitrospina sp.]MBT3508617.1 aminotransferase class V-fold PLP-dependent enzyme [Nitrospina sp.]MBT3875641.1 aminotransferase class V-fold PLP-dependent enzyme [Nitrospina sp.]MBT4048522.1 aminotransferase class V-fold PLP-dependent enzyme [Nitrospina sp.]MBT4558932.1 aminotransferase class V-fold PLP-dependent enzyme [Nitrospina sp.]
MDIEKIRKEFPVTEELIFFDHARVAPLPERVRKVVTEFVDDATRFGTAHYETWLAGIDQSRKSFARLINAGTDEVAFVKNTSEGLSIVANGLDWKTGDNVVIPDIEFPANVYPWWNLKRLGVETRMVRSVEGRVLFDDLVKQVDARTKLISISSVECNSGFRCELNRIGEFCKERDILFCVDAIQSLGILPMDVKRDHIDFLSADGHKWMLSVEGLGGFYISRDVLEKVYPVTVGWGNMINAADFMNYEFEFRPGAQRFEEGSPNTMSIHAFGAALDLLLETGIENIEKRVMILGNTILEQLHQRGLKVYSSTRPGERSGNIAFVVNQDISRLYEWMMENKVKLTVRDGLIRLSPHFYNSEDEIFKFFDLLDKYLK